MRQDAVKQAERERREKYRRQEEEREQVKYITYMKINDLIIKDITLN